MQHPERASMYIPNKDIEAFSRKYTLAFLVYLVAWLAGLAGVIFLNKLNFEHSWLQCPPVRDNIPRIGLGCMNDLMPLIMFENLCLLSIVAYWPLIIAWHPIQFIPYWERPEWQNSFNEPW